MMRNRRGSGKRARVGCLMTSDGAQPARQRKARPAADDGDDDDGGGDEDDENSASGDSAYGPGDVAGFLVSDGEVVPGRAVVIAENGRKLTSSALYAEMRRLLVRVLDLVLSSSGARARSSSSPPIGDWSSS
jgi:hypothetical protein